MAAPSIHGGSILARRRNNALRWVELHDRSGIEIGALDRPLVTTAMSNVRYVDHAANHELMAKYADSPNVQLDRLVDVSYVWGEKTLRESVGESQHFDYVIASHVIEHVPDLVGWLRDVRSILKDGGVLSLVVPDRRFTFDYRRPTSVTSAIIDAHVAQLRRPSPGQVYDHFSHVVHLDATAAWAGDFAPEDLRRKFSDDVAVQKMVLARDSEDYIDVHCWVFTPQSFFRTFRDLARTRLVEFAVAGFVPTEEENNEFYVALEALPSDLDPDDRLEAQLASIPSTSDLMDGQDIRSLVTANRQHGALATGREQGDADVLKILQQLSQELALLRGRIARLDANNGQTAELQRRVDERDRRIEELMGSTSWRATAPFRWITRRVRSWRQDSRA
jgi:2-polyprenyl-3-methyl-5-hydroxy-6-metoxy-1,4-benzoquinol methylase